MNTFEKKEKNLNELITKLEVLTSTYTQSFHGKDKIKSEKDEIVKEKLRIEKKNQELMREHKYLKEKIGNLQQEVSSHSIAEDRFNQDIEELSQETENLVNEIEKWQT